VCYGWTGGTARRVPAFCPHAQALVPEEAGCPNFLGAADQRGRREGWLISSHAARLRSTRRNPSAKFLLPENQLSPRWDRMGAGRPSGGAGRITKRRPSFAIQKDQTLSERPGASRDHSAGQVRAGIGGRVKSQRTPKAAACTRKVDGSPAATGRRRLPAEAEAARPRAKTSHVPRGQCKLPPYCARPVFGACICPNWR